MKYAVSFFCLIFIMMTTDACLAGGVIPGKKLTAGDGDVLDKFGQAVAVSGDYAVVGAYGDDDNGESSGSAYIFYNDGMNGWTQQQKLTAGDGDTLDKFGQAVAIAGDYAVVGASGDNDQGESSGAVYVFHNNGSSWTQVQKLTPADGGSWAMFGGAIAVSGDFLIVGAAGDDDQGESSGAAYIFQNNGTAWLQVRKLTASDGAGWAGFGQSVAISGDYAIVGANGDDMNGGAKGAVYVFYYNGALWSQVQKLAAADGASWDKFGQAIAIDGNSLIVGAPGDDDQGNSSGSAYVFYHNGVNWVEEVKLLAGDGAEADYFGHAVAISGNYAVVGAYGNDDNGISSGSAYVFNYDGANWLQAEKLVATDAAASDYFGQSVAMAGNALITGAYGEDDKGESAGAVYTGSVQNSQMVVIPQFTSLAAVDTDRVITFDASQSSCYELASGVMVDKICSYAWDFGGAGAIVGGNGSDILIYQYNAAGNYTVSLTLTEPVSAISASATADVSAVDVVQNTAVIDFTTSLDAATVTVTAIMPSEVSRAYIYWGDRTRTVSINPQTDFTAGIAHSYSRGGRSYNIRVVAIDAAHNRVDYTFSEDADLTVTLP